MVTGTQRGRDQGGSWILVNVIHLEDAADRAGFLDHRIGFARVHREDRVRHFDSFMIAALL